MKKTRFLYNTYYAVHCCQVGHGGRIWAKSEEGRGATFFFTCRNLRQSAPTDNLAVAYT